MAFTLAVLFKSFIYSPKSMGNGRELMSIQMQFSYEMQEKLIDSRSQQLEENNLL